MYLLSYSFIILNMFTSSINMTVHDPQAWKRQLALKLKTRRTKRQTRRTKRQTKRQTRRQTRRTKRQTRRQTRRTKRQTRRQTQRTKRGGGHRNLVKRGEGPKLLFNKSYNPKSNRPPPSQQGRVQSPNEVAFKKTTKTSKKPSKKTPS